MLEVNKPLRIGGTTVHLIGHGYAPKVTVKDAQGNVAFSGPVVMLPQDGNFTSVGAIKAPDARPERLAFEAFFLPTAVLDRAGTALGLPRRAQSGAVRQRLVRTAARSRPGKPENVYSLDPTGLRQLRDKRRPAGPHALKVGDGVTLPDGKGSIQLDGWSRWVKLQIGDTPGVPISLIALAFAVDRIVPVAVRPAASGMDSSAAASQAIG